MPKRPSKILKDLLKKVFKYSTEAPRIDNKLGRTAPIDRYIEVCQRHEFETVEMPKARANGWPLMLDFEELPEKVTSSSVTNRLREVIAEPHKSTFWKDIQAAIDNGGTKAVTSADAQMMAADKSLPG
jgi:hypothetical protein